MSSIKNPVGPQPPSVYWRRRLVLLLGLLAVVVVVVLIIVQPGRDATPASGGSTSPEPGSSETADPPAEEQPADGTCDPATLAVVAKTDAPSYGAEQVPQVSLTITNTGSEPCDYDVSPAAQLYEITSGADEIWKSSDCAQPADPSLVTLEPGVEQSTTPIPWDRTRSSTTTCEAQRPAVTAGGATYRLSVSVGEATSAEDAPFILE